MENPHNQKCFANHLGPWLIEPAFFANAVAAVKAGRWPMRVMSESTTEDANAYKQYGVSNGTAIISIAGTMMKGDSKFSDVASTVRIRQALRAAQADQAVNAILLVIDSPGGTLAGTAELAADVAGSKKPVYAHIDDLGASAAYWVASQSRRVTANATAMVGSIGTVAIVEDTSKAYEMAGVKVYVISTGEFKGAFADGTKITEPQLQYYQGLINELNEHFVSGVTAGRKMEKKEVKAVADGRVFVAAEAKKLGLIDAVQSLEETVAYVAQRHQKPSKMKAMSHEMDLRIRS
jgi:signal peptide peptidase SppA